MNPATEKELEIHRKTFRIDKALATLKAYESELKRAVGERMSTLQKTKTTLRLVLDDREELLPGFEFDAQIDPDVQRLIANPLDGLEE